MTCFLLIKMIYTSIDLRQVVIALVTEGVPCLSKTNV